MILKWKKRNKKTSDSTNKQTKEIEKNIKRKKTKYK